MIKIYHRFSETKLIPNRWDLLAIVIMLGIFSLFVWGSRQMAAPYPIADQVISLDPWQLPKYAVFTALRLFIAIFFSLLFTFIFGAWAAKSKRAERIIVPCIDILQSVPVLGFLSLTVVGFIALFPGSRLGPECAAIFAIFTAQAWNMCLSFYQSLNSIPVELKEVTEILHMSAWQRFWKLEVPFSVPGLLWNTMMSLSGSWIFLVAAETISVNNQEINLPGIGSYLGLAITQANMHAVLNTVIAMLIVILLYDQLIFRPISNWSTKFSMDQIGQEKMLASWLTILIRRTHVLKYLGLFLDYIGDLFVNYFRVDLNKKPSQINHNRKRLIDFLWYIFLMTVSATVIWVVVRFLIKNTASVELMHVFILGLITALRVLAVVVISSVIWVPIGVWVGLNQRAMMIVQPIAQFFAAFPSNLLFPFVVWAIISYHLNPEIWVTPLMLLGAQWYILFNVIAGTYALPRDLRQVCDNFGISGWQWWRRLILPGIFPYYLTGVITAVGGCWNVSIIAEVVSWGNTTLEVSGLGAYITEHSTNGNFSKVALGIGVMSTIVLMMNALVWTPLYRLAQSRYRLL